jgi:transcriptional regulator with XRE-family HTH domain
MEKPRERLTEIRRPASGIDIDAERLVRLRNEKPWSREKLAAAAGISPASVAKYENGTRRPKTEALAALCRALGCAPGDLLPAERAPAL